MILEISNGRVFIDGKETVNPEYIGYAILDYAESNTDVSSTTSLDFIVNESDLVEKYSSFIKENALRSTFERECLVKLLSKMKNNFVAKEFVKKGMETSVSYPTCYNFLNSAVDAGIIEMNPKTYSFVVDNK